MNQLSIAINEYIAVSGNDRTGLLPLLQKLKDHGFTLNEDVLLQVAAAFQLSPADVYGTATFYPYLFNASQGKYVIRICRNISCTMKNGQEMLQEITRQLKIKVGETTADKKFTLLNANCLGWCHKAPAMMINEVVFTDLTPQKISQILQDYISK